MVDLTVDAFCEDNLEMAAKVEPLRELIGILCNELKTRQTGRVQGEYPKSVAKILLMIAGILILIGLFFMATDAFACGAKGVPVAETAQEEYIEYEPLTVDIDGIQEV